MIELRQGRWQDVLSDVKPDCVIADPPYSERVHENSVGRSNDGAERVEVSYACWSPEHVAEFVASWAPRTAGWMACMTSHDLLPAWERAYSDAGRYHFAPVPIICTNPGARKQGDGPGNGTVYLVVARRSTLAAMRWRSLPPHYIYTRMPGEGGGGRGKPTALLRAIVCDYSNPGQLVVDPCAGYGSTLAAALQKGRRAIGAEVDAAVYAEARKRLDQVQTVDLFDPGRARQSGLEL